MSLPTTNRKSQTGRRQFFLMALGLIVLVLAATTVIVHNLIQTSRQVQEMYAESIQGIKVSSDLMEKIQDARLYSLYTLASTDPNVQLESADLSRAQDPLVEALLREASFLILKTEVSSKSHLLTDCWQAYRTVRNEVLSAVLEGSREEGLQLDRREGMASFDRLHQAVEEREKAYVRQAAERLEHIQKISRQNIWTVSLMLALVLMGATVALRGLGQNAKLLFRSRERFELAVAGSSDGIWDWDIVSNQAYFSPRWKRMIGYEDSELGGDYSIWEDRIHPDDAVQTQRSLNDYLEERSPIFECEFRLRHKDGHYIWALCRGAAQRDRHGKPFRMAGSQTDITARKQAQQDMDALHKQLLDSSRTAGMAEVATGVLHNVGNVLNSVSVSATLVGERLRTSKVSNLRLATDMLREKNGNLVEFLTKDPKGKLLLDYFGTVSDQLTSEQKQLVDEMALVAQHIEHIKEIVSMQQSYAKVSGAFENLPPALLVEDALRMNSAAFDRHRIQVIREFADEMPAVCVDRHKVLQILINLLRNAKYAMDAHSSDNKQLVIRITLASPNQVQIAIIDNGMGIAPENIVKIFGHGFTTKKDGHGFGLHSGAIAAKEMGGRLAVQSAGLGLGAEFTLELPVAASFEPKPIKTEPVLTGQF